ILERREVLCRQASESSLVVAAQDPGLSPLLLELHGRGLEALHHVGEEPRRHQRDPLLLHLNLEPKARRHFQVRGRQGQLSPRGVHQDAREGRDPGTGGDRSLDGLERLGQDVSIALEFQHVPPLPWFMFSPSVSRGCGVGGQSSVRPAYTAGTTRSLRWTEWGRKRVAPGGPRLVRDDRPMFPPAVHTVFLLNSHRTEAPTYVASVHRHTTPRPRDRIFLVSSWTCLYVLPRAGMSASIFLMPCNAVV